MMDAESGKGRPPATALPAGYAELLEGIKERIRSAQIKAALSVNRDLVLLYWRIGREILQRQEQEGWGAKVIERLAHDLKREFPEMKGLSRANLFYMRAFAEAYPDEQFVQQLVGQLPWGHNVVILTKLKDPALREWYARACIEHGWSRNVMAHQIESGLYERQGKAITNFQQTLPPPQCDLAEQTLKDPYVFDFLTLADDARERELEQALIDHVQRFLLELGVGFAFVGRQMRMEVGEQDFYLDLLFYHLRLRCFVVIDLKVGPFQPEYAGKMNFYLSAVDDRLRHPDDQPTIGLLLCKERDRLIVEYALRDMRKPIGVAEWETKLTRSLPDDVRASLPTIEELEAELGSKQSEDQGHDT